jgi:hypothetical protein
MIETTTGEIWNSQRAMEALIGLPMAGKYAYRLAKIAKACTKAVEVLVNQREELIKKYGTQKGQGFEVLPPDEKVPESSEKHKAFTDEWEDLWNSVKDEPVKLDVMQALLPEDLTISAQILIVLDSFIDIETPPKKE